MVEMQELVRDFHKAFGIHTSPSPTLADRATQELRVDLIREEFREFIEALQEEDLVEVADALGDLLYVVFGAGLAFGIDLTPVFDEIHRSNMTKVGGYKAENGKWIKPETYSPADVEGVLIAQGMAPMRRYIRKS